MIINRDRLSFKRKSIINEIQRGIFTLLKNNRRPHLIDQQPVRVDIPGISHTLSLALQMNRYR